MNIINFFIKFFSKSARLHSRSSAILSTFTETQKDLHKLNKSLLVKVSYNEMKVKKLYDESTKLNSLKAQHDKIISNIDSFLS